MKRLRVLWIIGFLFLPVHVWGAIAVDAHGKGASPESGGTSAQTESLTLGGSATALYVLVVWETNVTVSSIVWDPSGASEALTAVGSRVTVPDGVGYYFQLFRRLSPSTGTKNLTVTWSGNVATGQMYWVSFTGSDTSTGNRTLQTRDSGVGAGPGLTDANWASGDIEIHGVVNFSSTIVFDAGETAIEDDALFGGSLSAGLSYKTTSGTVGCTDVSTYAEVATAIIPASGGGGAETFGFRLRLAQ